MARTISQIFPRQSTLYDCTAIENLIKRYALWGGQSYTIEDGCLGYGHMVLFGDGLKTTIVKEIAVNTQYSMHTVRMYNKCPKKYLQYIA